MRELTLLVGFTILLQGAQGALRVCDIEHPTASQGTVVAVESRVLFTMHGAFLSTDGCPDHSFDIVILYPGIQGTPLTSFKLAPGTLEQLKPFYRTNGGTAVACSVLRAQVFYKKRFRSKGFGAGPVGNGFGPRGAFRVAFVLESVVDMHQCE
jgi:hypothetical protein